MLYCGKGLTRWVAAAAEKARKKCDGFVLVLPVARDRESRVRRLDSRLPPSARGRARPRVTLAERDNRSHASSDYCLRSEREKTPGWLLIVPLTPKMPIPPSNSHELVR